MVQLDAFGRPSKARFGSLPGIQSVPRAARYAGYQAILASPDVNIIVSDHLSVVQEGASLCEREAAATARHAEIWRAIRATVAQHARSPPQLVWTPSHKTPEEVISRGVGARSWVGNAWADFFATVALHEVTLSPNFGKSLQGRIAEAVGRASFVAWAGRKVLSSGKWSATDEEPRAPKPPPEASPSLCGCP